MNTGKWTLTGLAEAYYRNADDITHNTGTQYIFSKDNIIDKLTEETQREHTKMFTTAVNARYISDKLTLTASAGYRYESTPVNNSDINITYTGNNAPDNGKALTEASSKGMLPYINTYFQLSKLPRNSMLYGAASFSYNHTTRLLCTHSAARYSMPPRKTCICLTYGWHTHFRYTNKTI